jgi:mRNA interferase MazF
VRVGIPEGLKHESSVHCDALVSLAKAALTDFVGVLGPKKLEELHAALHIAVGLADNTDY